jgi:hypothetical protein
MVFEQAIRKIAAEAVEAPAAHPPA